MSRDNQELIWVDKEFAEEYNNLDSDKAKCNLVNKIIKQKGESITEDIEMLNEDLLRFKAFALNYKTEFEKVGQQQLEEMEKFYDESYYIFDKVFSQIDKAKKGVNEVSDKVKDLNNSLNDINTFKIEELIELINRFNSMSDEDKRIFELILKNERKS